ncbi:hypothetical protein BDP27DRAFT_602167 [Rhodocollybia butyracea]|uniref:Uncharacterized protein n=1 Tax=Rhodocollybia butyracea TaxID=206335 RepID=A0A9P5QAA4_9AGAR|nr:hypothetical protein BDP27DRAFT_602167 [Rhodocollybia butyracea]
MCIDSQKQSDSNTRHFASLIIILPSHSSGMTLQAKHGNPPATQSYTLANISTRVYTFYTGLDTLDIRSQDDFCYLTYHLYARDTAPIPMLSGISPVVPELRDLFMDWRARRSSGDEPPRFILFMLQELYSDGLCKEDEILLGHIAPLAKAYGFRMEIVDFIKEETSEHEIPHDYKECGDDVDLDTLVDELEIEDGEKYETYSQVIGFCDLGNNLIRGYGKSISKAIEETIVSGAHISHHGGIWAQIPLREARVLEDTMTVCMTDTRNLSFLMIRPEELDMNKGECSGLSSRF